jgi:hypothetical protein
MSVMADDINHSRQKWPKKQVSIRRDDKDFVVAFQPEDFVIFRNGMQTPYEEFVVCCGGKL